MIGPTGVGKTEIARRLARLADAPFIKVEATKFTEVGYVGRDVDTIVRDLVEKSLSRTLAKRRRRRCGAGQRIRPKSGCSTSLLPSAPPHGRLGADGAELPASTAGEEKVRDAAESSAKDCAKASSTNKEVDIEVSAPQAAHGDIRPARDGRSSPSRSRACSRIWAAAGETAQMKIREAMRMLTDEEAARLVNEEDLRAKALANVEQNGIVFLDEIDKIASRGETVGVDVSRQGVQRDLLPIVEGTTVSTKYGMVKTDHILFIASGAFHLSKPSDLIPELQGRFPSAWSWIRFRWRFRENPHGDRRLPHPAVPGAARDRGGRGPFVPDGIRRLAEIAWSVNEKTENIGARRLYTVMEKLLEEISFDAGKRGGRA